MGKRNFGWFAVWVPSRDWLCRKLEVWHFCQTLMWIRLAWRRGIRAVPILCILYSDIWLQLRKIHGKPSVSEPKGSRLISAEGDSFSRGHRGRWHRLSCWPCPPWLSCQATGSTHGERKCLPSYRNREIPTSSTLESKFSARALMLLAESGTPRS